jgi:hypothetical protein
MIPDIGNINVNVNGIPVVGIGGVNIDSNADIPPLNVRSPTTIRVADNRIWVVNPPNATQLEPPVVVQVGTPIVNIAGCVEVHKENVKTRNRNKQLVDNDPKGNTVLCDSGAPSFYPLNYESNRLNWETFYGDAPVVDGGVDTGDPPVPPDAPGSPEPPKTGGETVEDPPCPGPMALRIGDVAQNQKEKVSGFELQRDPKNPDGVKICVTLYEDIGAVESFLPAPQLITTTAVIATVATGSALLAKPLADLLLKVVKPVIKKVIGKVQTILGKTPYRTTQAELKTNEYRVKKGLLGINFAKQHQKKMKAEKEQKKAEEKAEKERKKAEEK